MHELSVMESILNIVVKHALKNDAKKILGISLRVGEMTDLVDEWMQRYFDYLSKETIAAGAVLKIERIPGSGHSDASGRPSSRCRCSPSPGS